MPVPQDSFLVVERASCPFPGRLVKPPAKDTGYIPDILLLNCQALASEP